MTPAELDAVVERACRRKRRYGRDTAHAVATERRRTGDHVYAYRCPFTDDPHWHIGHYPSMENLALLSQAIRAYRQQETVA